MKWIVLVLVPVLLMAGCIGSAGCHARGGVPSKFGNVCIIPTDDGGDYCDSAEDCEGQCLISENQTDGTCSHYINEPITYSVSIGGSSGTRNIPGPAQMNILAR